MAFDVGVTHFGKLRRLPARFIVLVHDHGAYAFIKVVPFHDPRHYAEFRAAETLLIRALSAFTIVAIGIGGVLVFALAPRHDSFGTLKGVDDAVQRWRAQYTLGGIVGAVPALGAYGVAMLRRARRVLRGEYEERNL